MSGHDVIDKNQRKRGLSMAYAHEPMQYVMSPRQEGMMMKTLKQPRRRQLQWALTTTLLLTSSAWALEPLTPYQRSWTAMMDQQKISVFIQQIDTKKIKGYRIIGRERQAFSGTVTAEGKRYRVVANEPKSSKSNGYFSLLIDTKLSNHMEGSWMSYQPNSTAKPLILKPQDCDANSPRTTLLNDDELQTSPNELSWMRNEIYARRGYIFMNKELATSFAQEDWYMPCYFNVDAQLTSTERKNIQLLKTAERYVSTHDWGR
jgi:hypothetical protein